MAKQTKQQKVTKFSELENKVAVLWMRAATKQEKEYNSSIETQKRICKEYAASHGITIKKQYESTHESAKSEGQLYRKMIADVAKDRDINIIIVSSFDRFSRNWIEVIKTLLYLKSKGIYAISATQPTEPDSSLFWNDTLFFNGNNYEKEK